MRHSSWKPRLWRLAERLAEKLSPKSSFPRFDTGPFRIARTEKMFEWFEVSQKRGWTAAQRYLRRQMSAQLTLFSRYLDSTLAALSREPSSREEPKVRLLYDELVAVEAEFEHFEFDLRSLSFQVVSPEICLRDIEFGRFEIILDGAQLPQLGLRVRALTPHGAASRNEVTHPHVLGEELCLGNADAPLKSAIQSGRLFDAFQIIQQTLATYNEESPYVSLDSWEGVTCYACGARSDADDADSCRFCQESVCNDCMDCCSRCSSSCCQSCLKTCGECDRCVCPGCLSECQSCFQSACRHCLTSGLCGRCHESIDDDQSLVAESSNELRDEQPSALAQPALQSDGLGETALPA